jgi:hypothetical protein
MNFQILQEWRNDGKVVAYVDKEGNFVKHDGSLIGDAETPPTVLAEHGEGAIGTGAMGAPQTRRWTKNGVIVTQIKFDITGFGILGDAADEVIGLVAGGIAYIGQNVVATNGVIFRAELSCIVVPGEGTAAITQDIDIATAASGTLEKDGDGTSARLINTAALIAGETVVNNAPALTDAHYYYVVAAADAATTGVYDAGQFILTTYGHPLLA